MKDSGSFSSLTGFVSSLHVCQPNAGGVSYASKLEEYHFTQGQMRQKVQSKREQASKPSAEMKKGVSFDLGRESESNISFLLRGNEW